jgi:hypothetical protein
MVLNKRIFKNAHIMPSPSIYKKYSHRPNLTKLGFPVVSSHAALANPLFSPPELLKVLAILDAYHTEEIALNRLIETVEQSNLPYGQKQERINTYKDQIQRIQYHKLQTLQELLRFPPHLYKHAPKLAEFALEGGYEQSVFIMTKFPEGDTEKDRALRRVIQAVKTAVKKRGYIPRLGSDRAYCGAIWDNAELYLCGCKHAIAIVEDRYNDELNPNVTMEWGWLRAMNKEVLYLVEEGFDRERADVFGLIRSPFSWEAPEKGIHAAVRGFLQPIRSP